MNKLELCGTLLASFILYSQTAQAADTIDTGATLRGVRNCVAENIDRLDDKLSPAEQIAHALAITCRSELRALADVNARTANNPLVNADELARGLSDGEMFLTDVLEHRTDQNYATSDESNTGFKTNKSTSLTCSSPDFPKKLACLSFFSGWKDGYFWTSGKCQIDQTLKPSDIEDEYLAALKRLNPVDADPPGGLISAILQTHFKACPQ